MPKIIKNQTAQDPWPGSRLQLLEQVDLGQFDSKFPPLAGGECRTKLYGLRILELACRDAGAEFLDYRLYYKPDKFRLSDFPEPSEGRLVVRTDPVRRDMKQDSMGWLGMPRLNLNLGGEKDIKDEASARNFMLQSIAEKGALYFIVSKCRNLEDYETNIRFDVDVEKGKARVWHQQINKESPNAEDFRNIEPKIIEYEIKDGRIQAPQERYNPKALKVVGKIIEYARKTGHPQFDASYVTYRDRPDEPEFYDLHFYREHSR